MPAGTVGWCDICADGTQVVATLGTAEIQFASDAVIPLPEPVLFTRAVSGLGTSFAVVKGNNSATGICYVISRSGTISVQTGTYGNFCVGLMIFGSQLLVVWQSSISQYSSRLFSSTLVPAGAAVVTDIPDPYKGTSQGFLDLDSGGNPIWTDSRRSITVGGNLPLVYPVYQGGYWVGQGGGTLSAQICGLSPTGTPFTLYQGDAFLPHAVVSTTGALLVAVLTNVNGAQFFSLPPLPPFQGSLQGGSAGMIAQLTAMGVQVPKQPNSHPVIDPRTGLASKVWQDYWTKSATQAAISTAAAVPPPAIPGAGSAGTITGPGVSVNNEIVLFSGTTGQALKRATGTGVVHAASGVYSASAVALGSEVSGDLPLSNVVQASGASKLLGRGSAAGAGDFQEITLDSSLTMTGTVLSAPTGGSGTVTHTGTLTANQLVIGNGGADIAPLGTLGTTTTVLHGNAAGAPTFAAVALATDISGDLPFANLVQASGASKLVGRGSASGAGDFQEITLGSGLTMSGTSLAASGGTPTTTIPATGWTIRNGIVINPYPVSVIGSEGCAPIISAVVGDNASVNYRFASQPLGGSTYTLIATVGGVFPQNTNSIVHGLFLSDGTKLIEFGLLSQTAGAGGINRLRVATSPNVTTSATGIAGPTQNLTPAVATLKIEQDVTNRTYYYYDGTTFVQFYQESAGTFLTETEAGFGGLCVTGSTGVALLMELTQWNLT